ncbi:hypothetical protein LOZ66_006845 [Ophidiomyces ophidiicola]|nr:hypothetical protein LOZ66_006845 [Ophidiomyces ophidiicola]
MENDVPQTYDPEHCLSTSREKDIASNLAFLSARTDDNSMVMAVCIEEHSSKEGVTIRIASNAGDLSKVLDGFKEFGEALMHAARRDNHRDEDIDAFFKQIIIFDTPRILARLRSRHASSRRSVGKPGLLNQLVEAIRSTKSKINPGLKNRAESMQTLFMQLENISDFNREHIQAHSLLGAIVRQAHEFLRSNDLGPILRGSPLDSSLLRHLPVAIGKLGRYYSAASELVHAARKYSLFHCVEISSFRVDVPDFVGIGRVHAEIQLLFFYEIYPENPRPRVICSSKSACYLCNLYFKVHGVFHVPRTHGRIYEKWILPDWLTVPKARCQELADVATDLWETLQREAEKNSKLMKRQYNHPNESILLPLSCWSSSIVSGTKTGTHSTIRPQPTASPVSQTISLREPVARPKRSLGGSSNPDGGRGDTLRVEEYGRVIIIENESLPYLEHITDITTSLHLVFGRLTLHFHFCQISPCQLLIASGEDQALWIESYHIVNVQDIPTTTKMHLRHMGPTNTRKVMFQLQTGCTIPIIISIKPENT